ncbi:cation diffusion facilitator family transporter [Altererythrobacter salegens]|uniref:Protein p34 n=1 Tax=Croceibacterium salegens TaxID=1737568 RepID=A0A6I4SX07_9SPHN|nr:cation diffusion facilitator family transporter [Croceibacterium salegens]MXO60575.1 cation diffusion facilitator family transporter [Croceibacterium salegens]
MTNEQVARARLTRSAAFASITMASILAAMKIWAVWKTDSTAMLGSLADTGLDLIASIATLIGVWIAARPADEDHRFGHGKAEALAALFQVVLITISAAGIAFRAINQLVAGERVDSANEGIVVSVLAILGTFALLAWQRHVIRSTGSIAIKTDNVHYKSDLFLNLAVIAALVMDRFLGIAGADPAFGLIIALWLAWGAWRASSEALDHLMDKEWPDAKRDEFIAVLARISEVHGMHDLRTRTSGAHDFAQFHISVDPKMTVAQAHDVMDAIEDKLAAEFPGVEVLIHTDPIGLVNETGAAAEELLPQDGSEVK